MEDLIPNIVDDIQYITEKRNDALEHFCDKVQMNQTPEQLQKSLDIILRFNKQIKTLEDCLVIMRTMGK